MVGIRIGRGPLKFILASMLLALCLLGTPAAAQQTFFVDKKICQWTNSPTAPNPNNCTALAGQVVPGTPLFYQVQINGPANPNPWNVTLTETYAAGFAGNVQNVSCVAAGSTTPVFTATTPTATTLGTIPVQPGQTVYCAMAGYFTAATTTATSAKNKVSLAATSSNGQTGQGQAEVNATVQTTATLPTNLTLTKTASPATVAAGGTTTFSITLSNDQNGQGVYLGGFLRLYDKLAKATSSVNLTATLQGSATCTASGGAVCPATPGGSVSSPLTVQTTTASGLPSWHTFAQWNYGTGSGFMPAGGSITIAYTVKIDTAETCAASPSGHGLSNFAQFDLLGQPGATLSELDPTPTDNISAPAAVTVTTTLQPCGTGTGGGSTTPSYVLTKSPQGSTTSPTTWGTNITYTVLFQNTSSTTFTNVRLYDIVYGMSPTPPFTATVVSATCVGAGCAGAASAPQTLPYGSASATMWSASSGVTLAPGASVTLTITLRYDMISCAATPSANWPIRNYGRAAFTADSKSYDFYTQPAYAYMTTPPICDFGVQKSFVGGAPSTLLFDTNYTYNVTFTNVADQASTMFTLADFLRIDVLGYAAGMALKYRYKCQETGGVSGYATQNPLYPGYQTGTVQWTNNAVNGSSIFQMGAPSGVAFPPGAVLTCTVDVEVARPAEGDPNCMGTGAANLQNAAMMFPNSAYPFSSGPPTDADLWESASAPLPRCYNLTVNKLVDQSSADPSGPTLNYTIEVVNDGDSITSLAAPDWLVLSDLFAGSYAPGAPSVSVSNPAGPGCGTAASDNCQWIASTGNPVSLGIKNLAADQKLTVTFALAPPFTAPEVRNDVVIEPKGTVVDEWYAREPETLIDLLKVPINAPPPSLGRICVRKFYDVNRDGVRQSGEAWLAGWEFTIRDANGVALASGLTATNEGVYCTPATLPAGSYTVIETSQTGWTSTTPVGGQLTFGLNAGDTRTATFGNCRDCAEGSSVLKICKVAGEGVEEGSPHSFTVNGDAFGPVPAGTERSPLCKVYPGRFEEGAEVVIDEIEAPGIGLCEPNGISVAPGGRMVSEDEENGVVTVEMGPGVTEVTYCNKSEWGYIEICKVPERDIDNVEADFRYTIEGVPGDIVVGMNSCSPPIRVPAGETRITEAPSVNWTLTGCGTWPNGRLVDFTAPTVTADVPAGDISTQTIVGCFNMLGDPDGPGPAGQQALKKGSSDGAAPRKLFKNRPATKKGGGK